DGSVATTTGETDKKTISTSYVVSQSAIDQYGTFGAVCTIYDSSGQSVVSNKATVEGRIYTLYITEQPKSAVLRDEWDYFDFTVKIAGGKAPYTYEWSYRYGAQPFESETYTSNDKTHTVTLLVDMQSLVYYYGVFTVFCKITDSSGQVVTSDSATVTDAPPLKVTEHPRSSTLGDDEFSFFGFRVTVSGGSGPYTYEWYYCYDGEAWDIEPHESFSKTDEIDLLVEKRNLYDHEPFTVFCQISDSSGQVVRSDEAYVRF
ncbi:MAG TPA: hypothetical protein GX704_05825, partial [Clostridiales bacterium]|nr:hypothetical protein [Clostridiales bacterium]